MKKICRVCGKEFEQTREHKLICSIECAFKSRQLSSLKQSEQRKKDAEKKRKHKEAMDKYLANNKEKLKENNKKRYEEDAEYREKVKAYQKKYYEEHKEEILKRNKQKYEELKNQKKN